MAMLEKRYISQELFFCIFLWHTINFSTLRAMFVHNQLSIAYKDILRFT